MPQNKMEEENWSIRKTRYFASLSLLISQCVRGWSNMSSVLRDERTTEQDGLLTDIEDVSEFINFRVQTSTFPLSCQCYTYVRSPSSTFLIEQIYFLQDIQGISYNVVKLKGQCHEIFYSGHNNCTWVPYQQA